MDVAVFGVPNEEFGEEVKAVVQPKDMADATPELAIELMDFCRSKLSHVKCPGLWISGRNCRGTRPASSTSAC